MVEALHLRRSPLAGLGFGVDGPRLRMAEEPFRSLVEVRSVARPATAAVVAPHVWQLGATWWLVDGPPPTEPCLEVPLAGLVRASGGGGSHVADVSAQRTTVVVAGENALRVLAHGCPLDLSRLPVGGCVQGLLVGAQVAIGRTGDDELRVYVRSAFARHLATWLMDAAIEDL
ncbi:sarcosine oxidase subunit gamma family protein [Nocardioides sp.]|uniref:sarcosine oxidase subunit gamma family protein n=1 Tax=Nocardioides sp. TaxID=35761 RepID=UPI00286CB204|nr:sarcosine oxidase subunit gamma family protein [Nocardioides sp.]